MMTPEGVIHGVIRHTHLPGFFNGDGSQPSDGRPANFGYRLSRWIDGLMNSKKIPSNFSIHMSL